MTKLVWWLPTLLVFYKFFVLFRKKYKKKYRNNFVLLDTIPSLFPVPVSGKQDEAYYIKKTDLYIYGKTVVDRNIEWGSNGEFLDYNLVQSKVYSIYIVDRDKETIKCSLVEKISLETVINDYPESVSEMFLYNLELFR